MNYNNHLKVTLFDRVIFLLTYRSKCGKIIV